jgi:hypothetical protein
MPSGAYTACRRARPACAAPAESWYKHSPPLTECGAGRTVRRARRTAVAAAAAAAVRVAGDGALDTAARHGKHAPRHATPACRAVRRAPACRTPQQTRACAEPLAQHRPHFQWSSQAAAAAAVVAVALERLDVEAGAVGHVQRESHQPAANDQPR